MLRLLYINGVQHGSAQLDMGPDGLLDPFRIDSGDVGAPLGVDIHQIFPGKLKKCIMNRRAAYLQAFCQGNLAKLPAGGQEKVQDTGLYHTVYVLPGILRCLPNQNLPVWNREYGHENHLSVKEWETIN